MRIISTLCILLLISTSVTNAQTKSKVLRFLIEPIIVGAVSGFVAARAAESYTAKSSNTIPRYWIDGQNVNIKSPTIGYTKGGATLIVSPGAYYTPGKYKRDGFDIVIIEDKGRKKLIGIILE